MQSFNDKISGSDVLKVLGLSWNASTDEFLVAGKDFVVGLRETGFGMGCTFTCNRTVKRCERCEAWIRDLALVRTLSIPRTYSNALWSDIVRYEIHVFCDASPKAYGACAYIILQQASGDVESTGRTS